MTPKVAPAKTELVELRNATRTTLRFSVPGQSIRLLPGAQVKVPKGYLQSSEIKILYREGSLVQVPLATLRATAVAASAVAPPPTGTTGVTPAIDVTAGRVETADSDLAELDLEEEEAPAKPDVRTSPRPIKK